MMLRMVGRGAVVICDRRGTYKAEGGVLVIPADLEQRALDLGFRREVVRTVAIPAVGSDSPPNHEEQKQEPTVPGETVEVHGDESKAFMVEGVPANDSRYADYQFFRDNGMTHEEAIEAVFGAGAVVVPAVAE